MKVLSQVHIHYNLHVVHWWSRREQECYDLQKLTGKVVRAVIKINADLTILQGFALRRAARTLRSQPRLTRRGLGRALTRRGLATLTRLRTEAICVLNHLMLRTSKRSCIISIMLHMWILRVISYLALLAFSITLHFENLSFIKPIIIIINSYTLVTSVKPTHGGLYAIYIEWTKPSEVENHSLSIRLLRAAETIIMRLCTKLVRVDRTLENEWPSHSKLLQELRFHHHPRSCIIKPIHNVHMGRELIKVVSS